MSKIISYDFGHMEGGQDGSANGIVYEYKENRRYGQACINYLKQAGYECVNCTPPDSNMTLQQSLSYRTDHANTSGSALHLCFHINAFNGSAHGAECEIAPTASDKSAKVADSILTEVCKLGFINRGVNRPNLWVTKHTNMPAVLIEPFFCDSDADCKIYNPDTLGKAIAQGVLNVLGGSIQNTVSSQQVMPTVKYQAHVQNVGWQNSVTNGDIAGTTGQNLRMESLAVTVDGLPNIDLSIEGHVQNIGWQGERRNGEPIGTVGRGLRLEAVKMSLVNAPGYHIQYQAHVQNKGWMDWVQDGAISGTTGEGLRLEAIRIKITK